MIASIGRSFGLLFVGQAVSRLLAFAVVIHLGRVLGPDGFGVLVFAMSVLGYAALVIEIGFDTLAPLEVARGQIPVPDLVRAVVTLRLMMLAVAFGALALFAWLAPVTPMTRVAITVYGASLIANVFDLGWVFMGAREMAPATMAEITTQALQAAGAFLLVREPEHLLRMPWVFLVSRLITVAGLVVAVRRRHGPFGLGLDRELVSRLLPACLPLSGAASAAALVINFDTVLLGLWTGAFAVGVYGAANRVAWVPSLAAIAYFTSLRPVLARGSVSGFPAIAPVLRRSVRAAGALGFGIAGGGLVLADPLVALFYGPHFAAAAAPLRLLLVSVAFLFVSRHYRALLQAFQHQVVDFKIMLASATTNVVLNIWLIPRTGVVGAAAATVVSEGVILAATLLAARRLIGDATDLRSLAGAVVSSAAMAGTLELTGPLPLVGRLALGAVVYLGLILAFRVVSFEDVREALGT